MAGTGIIAELKMEIGCKLQSGTVAAKTGDAVNIKITGSGIYFVSWRRNRVTFEIDSSAIVARSSSARASQSDIAG